MDEEPPKKKAKKKKQVRWEASPPIKEASNETGRKNKNCKVSCRNSESSVVEESEPDLVIDTDREDNFPPVLENMENEIEKRLEEKAKKNNLSVMNVKNILKAVITNQDVVEMVNTSLKGEAFDQFHPKFTRSKTKELFESYDLEQSGSKSKSDYAYILDQELAEDSSDDEEYDPNQESDEENKTAELLPESPVPDSPYVSSVCGEESCPENVENIGQRTRSKLCLSETSLETIEQQFIPPDITTDMYDTECDNQDWLDFLKGIQNPLDRTSEIVEDENDPEYNVMVEESVENIDFEELRHDRAVKVTKCELHALMNEWFGCEDFSSDEEVESLLKKGPKHSPAKSKDKIQPPTPIESPPTPPPKYNCQAHLDELFKNINIYKRDNFFSQEQYCLLRQQVQQHIQLLLQTFLLTYKHPYVESDVTSNCKEMLYAINCLAVNVTSTFNVINLKSSISLLESWESYMSNSNNSTPVIQFMEKEFLNGDMKYKKRTVVPAKIPPQIMSICADSTAFIFPLLLPDVGVTFTAKKKTKGRIEYSVYENHLIALGLEQFTHELKAQNNDTPPSLMELGRNISEILMPHREPRSIMAHIKWLTKESTMNPVKYFYEFKVSPPIKHFVVNITKPVRLRDQPQQLIPPNWKKHLFKRPNYIYCLVNKKKMMIL